MKKLVSVRQIILILMISLVTVKVLYLPSLIAKDIGRNGFIYILFMLLLDFLVLLIFLYLFCKNPNLSFFEILEIIFGNVVARILMFLFFLFFMLKCITIFNTNFSYLNENLYTSLRWYTFSFPILVAVFFMTRFGVNAFSRLIEICAPVILVGFLASFLVGFFKADFSNLLPIFEKDFFSSIPVIFRYSFWFGDYIIFIVFFGNIKEDKKFVLKTSVSIIISIVLVAMFFAVSFALFSYNSVCHTNSISDMLQVLPSTSDTGSFDWVLILIWDGALFLFFSLNVLGAFYSFRQSITNKWQLIVVGFILSIVLVLSLFIHFDIHSIVDFLRAYACYFCAFVEYFIPLMLLIFSFKIRRVKDVKVSN